MYIYIYCITKIHQEAEQQSPAGLRGQKWALYLFEASELKTLF